MEPGVAFALRPLASAQSTRQPVLSSGAIALLLLSHLLLGVLMKESRSVATLHAVAVLAAAFFVATVWTRPLLVACAVVYIAGAEVLWRMTGAGIFWESAKFAIAGCLAVSLLVTSLAGRRGRIELLPVLYFVLMLPSLPATIAYSGLIDVRESLSFNLSGPLALAMSVWFFANTSFSSADRMKMLVVGLASILAVSAAVAYSLATADVVRFAARSNLTASGGFGPNQVSSILGLGALLCFLLSLQTDLSPALRKLLGLSAVLLVAQSALTFSRSGLYLAVAAAVIAAAYQPLGGRSQTLFRYSVAAMAAGWVLLVGLETLTAGAILDRFMDFRLTGRDELVVSDLKIWMDNPLLGVGPGMAPYARATHLGKVYESHTEYSRLLAEHGTAGIIALGIFAAMVIRAIQQNRSSRHRGLALSLLTWSLLFMAVNGMRLAAPAILLGMTHCRLFQELGFFWFTGSSRPRLAAGMDQA